MRPSLYRFTTLSIADRIAVLADGRIVEPGTHEELLGLKRVYHSLYGLYAQLAPVNQVTRPAP